MITNATTILFALSFCSFVYLFFYLREKQKNQEIKNYVDSILSLNTSHLHDAANFFALIKSELSPQEIQNKQKELERFARGAAYHFRALFEELRNSQELFDSADLELLQKNKLGIFYQKERVDLKDLLELELFQLHKTKRIKIEDLVTEEYAFTFANFSLLSKVILNLTENALKYTEQDVKIQIKEAEKQHKGKSYWQIKIFSYGKAIPEKAIKELKGVKHSKGHGLRGAQDIMDFHQGKLEINTLDNNGSSVSLSLLKANNETLSQDSSISNQDFNSMVSKREMFHQVLGASLALILISSISLPLLWNQHKLKQNFYNTLNTIKEVKSSQNKKEKILNEIIQIKNSKSLQEYNYKEANFLMKFASDKHSLISYILLKELTSSHYLQKTRFLLDKNQELLKHYPQSSKLHYNLAELYKNKKNYLAYLKHSALALYNLLGELYKPYTELDLLNRLYNQHLLLDFLALEQEQDLKNNKFSEMNGLIEQQDSQLGLEFRL